MHSGLLVLGILGAWLECQKPVFNGLLAPLSEREKTLVWVNKEREQFRLMGCTREEGGQGGSVMEDCSWGGLGEWFCGAEGLDVIGVWVCSEEIDQGCWSEGRDSGDLVGEGGVVAGGGWLNEGGQRARVPLITKLFYKPDLWGKRHLRHALRPSGLAHFEDQEKLKHTQIPWLKNFVCPPSLLC